MNDAIQKAITISKQPFNAETPRSALREPLTANTLFFVRNHFDVPDVDEAAWKLSIGGAVGSSRQFTLEEIQAFPNRKILALLECAGNGRTTLDPPVDGTLWDLGAVAQAEFTGTSLHNILSLVQPATDSVEILFTGADSGEVRTGESTPYARSLPLELALHPDVMLVWGMNGERLPLNHGYPLRLLVPGWYGMASVKWLQEISLLTIPFEGFFQQGDYVYREGKEFPEGAPVQEVRVRSLILSHSEGDTLGTGTHKISGVAWTGQGKISEVFISIDGGPNWKIAALEDTGGQYGWTRWHASVELNQPGSYSVIARAADAAGNVQPPAPVWNRGGYGNNVVQQITLRVSLNLPHS
jgi:DMSO/TMAO reductase YedYZ molybdopterin-dependent catalytic subunit